MLIAGISQQNSNQSGRLGLAFYNRYIGADLFLAETVVTIAISRAQAVPAAKTTSRQGSLRDGILGIQQVPQTLPPLRRISATRQRHLSQMRTSRTATTPPAVPAEGARYSVLLSTRPWSTSRAKRSRSSLKSTNLWMAETATWLTQTMTTSRSSMMQPSTESVPARAFPASQRRYVGWEALRIRFQGCSDLQGPFYSSSRYPGQR